MKKLFSVLLAALMLLAVVPMASFAEETAEPTVIDTVTIDFVYPEVDQPAVTLYALDTEGCTVVNASWYEAQTDSFLDESSTFSEGTYFINVFLEADDGYEFDEDVKVIINGNEAISVQVNEDGSITAIGEFNVETSKSVLDVIGRVFYTIKLLLLAFIHLIGTMIGLK